MPTIDNSSQPLDFIILFNKAIAEWPSVLHTNYPENMEEPDIHIVLRCLLPIHREVEEYHARGKEDMLKVLMHYSIFRVLLDKLMASNKIRMEDVNSNDVKRVFDIKISEVHLHPELGWPEEDQILAKQYLELNT